MKMVALFLLLLFYVSSGPRWERGRRGSTAAVGKEKRAGNTADCRRYDDAEGVSVLHHTAVPDVATLVCVSVFRCEQRRPSRFGRVLERKEEVSYETTHIKNFFTPKCNPYRQTIPLICRKRCPIEEALVINKPGDCLQFQRALVIL